MRCGYFPRYYPGMSDDPEDDDFLDDDGDLIDDRTECLLCGKYDEDCECDL